MSYMQFFQSFPWWASLLFIGAIVLFIHFGLTLIYKYGYPRLKKGGRVWFALFVKTFYKPFRLFVWFAGLSVLASLYAHRLFDIGIVIWIKNLLQVGITVAFGWGLYIFATGVEHYIAKRLHYDQTTVNFLSKLTFIIVAMITLLLVLPLFGIQIAGLLAFGGFSGIMVGFAAKEALANVMGGFLIAMDKPFRIGDWIYSIDGSIEGVVEHIGWRLTMLRTFEKRPLYIPNSLFTSLSFTNATQMTNRRIQTTIGVRFQDEEKLPVIIEELRSYITNHDEIDKELLNLVHLNKLGTLGFEILIRAYTKTVSLAEYLKVQEEVLFTIIQIIKKHNAEITYPTSTTNLTLDGAFGNLNGIVKDKLDLKLKNQ